METNTRQDVVLSIVIPAYNAEKNIKICLDSIIRQPSLFSYECIVVDDGSTDDSLERVGCYSDARVTIIANTENRGIEAALNQGIKAADCDWLFRLDSDDVCLPARLERQLAYLEAHPATWVLGAWAEMSLPDGGSALGMVPVQDGQIKARLLVHSAFFHPAAVVRRGLFDRLSYSAKYPGAEDYDLWCKLAAHPEAEFHNLPEVLLRYAVSEQGISRMRKAEQTASTRRVREAFLGRWGLSLSKERGAEFYHALADGVAPAAVTEAEADAFVGLLADLKQYLFDARYVSVAHLQGEITPRFVNLTRQMERLEPELARLLKTSEFYQEAAL